MQEWTGELEDGRCYPIDQVSFGSSRKKFKWRCSKGHEWSAAINDRTARKTGCPYCFKNSQSEIASKTRLSEENSLKTWCLNNGELGQKLKNEWTGIQDDGRRYKIGEVARASGKKFKWKCSAGHEWYTTIKSRTSQKTGCPYCFRNSQSEIAAKAVLSEENSLKTWCLSNGSFGKRLLSEWTGECDDGSHYEIGEVSFGSSHKKFKWRCSKEHEWFAKVNGRAARKTVCPYCSGHRVSNDNRLKTWCLNNGVFGEQLKSEWTGICEDGNTYKIDEASYGSHKKFKWHCQAGHEWLTTVNGRTAYKQGCPYCNNQGTSYPEQFIFWSLKQLFPNTETRCKVLKSPQNPQGVEFDIGIPGIPLCIEYSPTRWHEGKEERDQYKKDLCEQCGVRLIQIVEDSYDILDSQMKPNYICFKMNYSQQDEILTKIVDYILKSLGHSILEIDLEKVKKNAWDYSKGKIDPEESLVGVYPELAKEWHPALNDNLKPDEIKCGSNKIVYWQCPKCKYGADGEWQAMVYHRTHGKTGCTKCGHNWYKAKQGLPQRYKGLYSYLNDQENSKSK